MPPPSSRLTIKLYSQVEVRRTQTKEWAMLDLKYSIYWLSINRRDDINSCLENGVRFTSRNVGKIRSVSSRKQEVALFVFGVRVWRTDWHSLWEELSWVSCWAVRKQRCLLAETGMVSVRWQHPRFVRNYVSIEPQKHSWMHKQSFSVVQLSEWN